MQEWHARHYQHHRCDKYLCISAASRASFQQRKLPLQYFCSASSLRFCQRADQLFLLEKLLSFDSENTHLLKPWPRDTLGRSNGETRKQVRSFLNDSYSQLPIVFQYEFLPDV